MVEISEQAIEDLEANTRRRRDRDNIQDLLLDAAIVEFGQKGFDGASTTSIARRADAHQPQINYHFSSKEELWFAAVDLLFDRLDEQLDNIDFNADPVGAFGLFFRRMAEFMYKQPELNQIIIQLAASDSERLRWAAEKHIRPRHERLEKYWAELQSLGVAAPIDVRLINWVLMGATGLPLINADKVRLLVDGDSFSDELFEAHVAGLLDTLLPGRHRVAGERLAGS